MVVRFSGEKTLYRANFFKPIYIGSSHGHLCNSTAFLL